MLATRVEEISKPCVELALDAIGGEFGEQGAGCQTALKARGMSEEMALISCLTLKASIHCLENKSSMCRVA